MRIGNIDDLEKTGNSENLIHIMQAKEYENLSKAEKRRNWWHYHKWYVVCGVILLGIAVDILGNALGLWKKYPDFQIAYVGEWTLSEDAVSALEEAFASMGEASQLDLDFNKDGRVIVQINQYISSHPYADVDAVYYDTVSEITLIGDISNCESYFFLMDDPERLQREYQVLAAPDGSCPDDADHSVDDKVLLWTDCPALLEAVARVEAEAPEISELLPGLYIGRRCFYNDARIKHEEKCIELWNRIISK